MKPSGTTYLKVWRGNKVGVEIIDHVIHCHQHFPGAKVLATSKSKEKNLQKPIKLESGAKERCQENLKLRSKVRVFCPQYSQFLKCFNT